MLREGSIDDVRALVQGAMLVRRGSVGREVRHPSALPRCFDCPVVVVRPGPGDGLDRVQPCQDGEAGDDGAGAADASTAGDFDTSAGVCVLAQGTDMPEGMLAVAGQQEVWPVDPVVRPAQLVFVTATKPLGAQVETVVG